MSVNQINQHESLTNFESLPIWYRVFWQRIDELNSATTNERWIYTLYFGLKSYLLGVCFVGGIGLNDSINLEMLIDEARKFAESKLVEKVA